MVKSLKLLFILTASLLVGSLINQNIQLRKQLLSLNSETTTKDLLAIYQDDHFSFNYPEFLFPITEKFDNKTVISFYLDESSAKKAEKCYQLKLSTMEDPCGYGTLVFFTEIYLNPRDNESNVNWLFDNKNSDKNNIMVDNQRRSWQIVRGIPWTGSKMNINNDYFVYTNGGEDKVVSIAWPEYSQYRISTNLKKNLLSTFNFTN